MQRIKHPPLRNKINLSDPAQLRAWTRRLGVSADGLKTAVDKVGHSIAAVTKEVELTKGANCQASPDPIQCSPPEFAP
jgi:hypothetical protein